MGVTRISCSIVQIVQIVHISYLIVHISWWDSVVPYSIARLCIIHVYFVYRPGA